MTIKWWITGADPAYLAPGHMPHHYPTLPSMLQMLSTIPMPVLPIKWEPGDKQAMWSLSQLFIVDIYHTYPTMQMTV